MKRSLLNLSGKIDGKTIAALFEIDNVAGALNIPYFIVGATARDILLQYAHNIHTKGQPWTSTLVYSSPIGSSLRI